ncbi:hypothetical protein [Chelonobacter oris]|uniref:hypothetical protein n=1 Tax=Chelonobacter oris TaxID=505317 RepID=UPI00244BFCBE|nr:hypothetical protein [Chelonobacter oris]
MILDHIFGESVILPCYTTDSTLENSIAYESEERQAAHAQFEQWRQNLPKTRYILLNQADSGVTGFCRLENTPPQQYHGCSDDRYIKILISNYDFLWAITMPGKQFFFAEGQGEHFAKPYMESFAF